MSRDEKVSREAQLDEDENKLVLYDLKKRTETDLAEWIDLNIDKLVRASQETQNQIEMKWNKMMGPKPMPDSWNTLKTKERPPVQPESTDKMKVILEEKQVPAFIKQRSSSDPPKAPESQDVIYLSELEVALDKQINTLDFMLVPDPDLPWDWAGPFIERCVGRDPESHKMKIVKVRAKKVPIQPAMVMQYLGSVVQDHQSVHTNSVVISRRRWGYVFDRFYIDPKTKKRHERCCMVIDRVHQSALMYEKFVDKRSRKPIARIRRIRGAMGQLMDDPMYRVIGAGETDYRDLKRLFERNFLNKPQDDLSDDIGLKLLVG
jgi:hypothetical protein